MKCKGWEWKKGNHITQGNFSSSTSEALLADSDFVLYDKLFDQHYDVENYCSPIVNVVLIVKRFKWPAQLQNEGQSASHKSVFLKCEVYVEPCIIFFRMDLGMWLPMGSQLFCSSATRRIRFPIQRPPKHWLLTSEPKLNARS